MEFTKVSPERFRSELLTGIRRGEAILVYKNVDDRTVDNIKEILKETHLEGNFEQTTSIEELLRKSMKELLVLAQKPVIITDIDLENKEQDRVLSFFRTEKNITQSRGVGLNQLLIIKPGTSGEVPSWHSCFNWTKNI